jgi:hypothetical protein
MMKLLATLLTLSIFAWSNIGNIAALQGSAKVIRDNRTVAIKNGMVLKAQDEIVTAQQSRVQVILSDDTVVTIGPDTKFVFDKYSFGNGENSEVAMQVKHGFFRSVTGKIGKIAPERFKVKTASATIGVRGTDFGALVTDNKEVISCYRGEIFAKIGDVSHTVKAGMELDNTGGKVTKKAMSKNVKVQFLDNSGNLQDVKADEVADAIQQDIQKEISTPLNQPTVEFTDR